MRLNRADLFTDNAITATGGQTSHAFSPECSYTSNLVGYVIQTYLRSICSDYIEWEVDGRSDFEHDHGCRASIIEFGAVFFVIQNRIVLYQVKTDHHEISCKGGVDDLVKEIRNRIENVNPLRGKFIQLIPQGGAFQAIIKQAPRVSFADLVLDKNMVEDIRENTLAQLTEYHTSNGIILHGHPGTGKSLTCRAITAEAVKAGYTVCLITSPLNFSLLDEFVADYLAPCIVIFEDIDSYAGERLQGEGALISDFLQLLSGVTNREKPVVAVATTNHLQLLDQAVKNRPVRFNRKYEFSIPSDGELNVLIDSYFGDGVITEAQKRKCHGLNFVGAHVAEIKRTAGMIAKKRRKTLGDVFEASVDTVLAHFAGEVKQTGFVA